MDLLGTVLYINILQVYKQVFIYNVHWTLNITYVK